MNWLDEGEFQGAKITTMTLERDGNFIKDLFDIG